MAPAAPSNLHDRPASRARSLTGETGEVVQYSPPVELRANVPVMVTDTGDFEDHVVVSHRQQRSRAPGVATPAPTRRSRHEWEKQESVGTAGASLPSPERLSSVPDLTWPEVQSTLLARTEPPECTAERDNLPAVPETSAWEDVNGFPLMPRSDAASPSRGNASPVYDAGCTCVAVTHHKRNAKKTGDDLRVWERESRSAENNEEQSYCRLNASCKISTDAGRGREYRERRDSRPADDRISEEILNFKRNCDFSSCQRRGGVPMRGQDLRRDRQFYRGADRRDVPKEDFEQYNRKGGRRRPKEDRMAGDVYHDYRRVHWSCDSYDDRRAYRDEKLGADFHEPVRFHHRLDQWRMERSHDKRKEHRFVRNSDRYDERRDNRRQPPGTFPEPCLNEQDRQTERTHLKREPDYSCGDPQKAYRASRHPKFHGDDLSTGALYDRGCVNDATCDYKYGDYGRKRDGCSHYEYAPRLGHETMYYDELYRTNPLYKQQVDAYYSRFGYSSAQQIDWRNVRAGPLSADAYLRWNQNFADDHVHDNAPQLQEVLKFPRPHPIVSFYGLNGLVKLVPTISGSNPPQLIELHSLTPLFQKEPCFRELEAFPGPLIRSETHKHTVIHFCKKKIASFAKIPDLPDRSSHILLWELLVLLLRQNGLVSGSEIAELLIKDHEMLEPTPSVLCSRPMCDGDADVSSNSSGVCTGSSFDDIVVCDGSQLGTITTSHAVAKFREFLLFGRKKCALEWAEKHGLWGHALSLASRIDNRTHVATMARFTNALSLNDPLRTLYQHLSGRQPAAVTLVAAEKWGEWRPHLAMILSNPSTCPEADARSVTILGDALASHGCLSAAHFCYVVAHAEFGSYSRKCNKLVLLGASHQTLPFREFASNEAIHCTEIYEYARSLSDPSYTLPHLQVYKFLHAMRLAEYGFPEEALLYCEILAEAMAQHCMSVHIAAQTYELANRLKYHVPEFIQEQTERHEIGEAIWLDALAQMVSEHRAADNSAMPQAGDHCTFRSDGESDGTGFMTEILSADSGFQSQPNVAIADFSGCDIDRYVLRQPENYFSSYVDTSVCKDISPPLEQWSSVADTHAAVSAAAEQCSSMAEDAARENSQIQASADLSFLATAPPTVEDCLQSAQPRLSTVARPSNECNFTGATGASQPCVSNRSPQTDTSVPPCPPASTEAVRFDYYSASVYQQHPETLTSQDCGSGVSSSTDVRVRRDYVDDTTASSVHRRVQPKRPTSGSERARPATDKPREAARKSWLGAIFEKIAPRQPNQIILPDDNDPCIVWDEDKKCWVDKNAVPGEADGPMAAPPKDSTFGGQKSFSGKPGQSRFHMSKQRSLRRRYVDVLNADSSKASGDSPSTQTPFLEEQPACMQGAPKLFVPQLSTQQSGSSGCDFVSCAPVPDQTATLALPLSPVTSVHYWSKPMPAPAPMMFSTTSSTATG
ncbi:uncharacterized protein LOC142560033 [Dermacentor variabilis]|uniref:uncharacterized protein LOC142560033 n=1 Tax=Dermacentor variabilis TaxID=34621 RepID=UPI003F5C2A16